MTSNFKMESGIQLLARLQRKPGLEIFYSNLFEDGLSPGNVIKLLNSSSSTSLLLMDFIAEALIPTCLGGVEVGVVLFNTDGNFNQDILIQLLKNKISLCAEKFNFTKDKLDTLLQSAISNLLVLEIYEATQLYTSIHNLSNILMEKSNISIVIFDTLTSFYWSEQGYRVTNVNSYLNKILKLIQATTKTYNVTILYSQPECFSSGQKCVAKQTEICYDHLPENVDYQVQIVYTNGSLYEINLRTLKSLIVKRFKINEGTIEWI